MQRVIYKKLAWLNELPTDEAECVLRECGGTDEWSRAIASARPFPMLDHLYQLGEQLWPGKDFGTVERRLNSLLER